MNSLQKLLKLRGISVQEIASKITPNYHMVQKNIKGTYRTKSVQQAIAMHLQLTWEQTFGPNSQHHLQKHILKVIEKQGQAKIVKLKTQLLGESSLQEAG